jgi:hypothetical protein
VRSTVFFLRSSVEMIAELKDAANKLVGETVPGVKEFLIIGLSLAKAVEKIPGLKGNAKMDAVLACLREILAGPIKEKLSAEQLAELHNVVDNVIPTVIMLAIEASRAGDFIKKVGRKTKAFFCVPCFSKKVPATEAVVAPAPAVAEPTPAESETRPTEVLV